MYTKNEEFDVVRAMKIIPEEFILDEEENQVYDFLKRVITSQLHEKRENLCNLAMLKVDRFNIDSKLLIAKKANVRINESREC